MRHTTGVVVVAAAAPACGAELAAKAAARVLGSRVEVVAAVAAAHPGSLKKSSWALRL
jgi:hypothetical protein